MAKFRLGNGIRGGTGRRRRRRQGIGYVGQRKKHRSMCGRSALGGEGQNRRIWVRGERGGEEWLRERGSGSEKREKMFIDGNGSSG